MIKVIQSLGPTLKERGATTVIEEIKFSYARETKEE